MCIDKIKSQVIGTFAPSKESKNIFPYFKYYGIKVESPSDLEIELSQRKHRWPEMNKTMNDFFKTTVKINVGGEIDALKIFGLPNIDEIRKSIVSC